MDVSALSKGKDAKGKPSGKKGTDVKKGKGGSTAAKTSYGKGKTEPFDGYCNHCKKHGHRM